MGHTIVYLNASSILWNKSFDSRGIEASCKLLLLRLFARNDRHSKNILIDLPIQVQNIQNLLASFFISGKSTVACL